MSGRIQRQDVKTSTEIVTAGGVAADLIGDDQIYVGAASLNQTLRAAILSGAIGGGLSSWAASTAYTAGKVVAYSGNVYIAQSGFTSGITFELDALNGYWKLINTPANDRNLALAGSNFESGTVSGWTMVNSACSNGLPITVSSGGAPYRQGFSFTITSASVQAAAVYVSANGNQFNVTTTITPGTTLATTGTGAPASSGTLTLLSGSGASTVTYSAVANSAATVGMTLSATSTNNISGTNSLQMVTTGTVTGDMAISQPFKVDVCDRGKPLQVKFSYKLNSGTVDFSGTKTNSLGIAIYDPANNAWIIPSGAFNFTQSSGAGVCSGTFQTPINMTSLQLAIFQPLGATFSVSFDEIYVGPQITANGPAIGDFSKYTMAIGATTTAPTKGTVAIDNAIYRRVGDSLEISYQYHQTAAGSAGVGVYLFSLPPGLVIDTTKVPIDVNGRASSVGQATAFQNTSPQYQVEGQVQVASTTQLSIYGNYTASSGGGVGTVIIGDAFANLANADVSYSFTARIPIVGWSSNSVQSADSDNRIVAARAYLNSAQSLTNGTLTQVTLNATNIDKLGTFNTSTSAYIAPTTGTYFVNFSYEVGSNSTGQRIAYILKNGANYAQCAFPGDSSSGGATVSSLVELNAGDALTFYAFQDSGATLSLFTGSNLTFANIYKLSGSAVVSATESVAALYNGQPTGTINGGRLTATFPTKIKDTHNAYSGGSYVVPAGGVFSISAQVDVVATYSTGAYTFNSIFVNGVEKYTAFVQAAAATTTDLIPVVSVHGIPLLAGDVVTIRASTGGTSPAYGTNAAYSYFSIVRTGT